MEIKKQSNPFSTGNGGGNFESRVQAAYLLMMLVQRDIPCIPSGYKVNSIKFQTKYDGCDTDDFVMQAINRDGQKARLYAQVKHEVSIVRAETSTFSKVISSAWADFKKEDFDSSKNSIVLITGPLSKTDINHVRPILEWARHSISSDEFFKKINTDGFASQEKIEKLSVFKEQLTGAKGNDISDCELWEFLKVFHLIGYDLDVEHSVFVSLMYSIISMCSSQNSSFIWSKLITCVERYNQNAGTIHKDNLPDELIGLFVEEPSKNWEADFSRIINRSRYIFDGIISEIGSIHINRDDQIHLLTEQLDNCEFLYVTGERGIGKSSLVKEYFEKNIQAAPVIYLRAEDLDCQHLNDVFVSMGVESALEKIEANFSLFPTKYLVIESIEKILEIENSGAFIDLLRFIKNKNGWKVIATGRDYAYKQLLFSYLQPRRIKYDSLRLTKLSDSQVEYVFNKFPGIKPISKNAELMELLKVPFFLSLAVQVVELGATFSETDTEKEFRSAIWRDVISKESYRQSGMHIKRRKVFIDIAVQRAKKMVYGIPEDKFDPEVVSKLEEDNLLRRDNSRSLISPAHDVLEDWAIGEFIEQAYNENQGEIHDFLSCVGVEPAIGRAFRLWLSQKLRAKDNVNAIIASILKSDKVSSHWKDEVIVSVLQSEECPRFLYELGGELFENDCDLFKRFCFMLRISCQVPNPRFLNLGENKDVNFANSLILTPHGPGWESIIKCLFDNKEKIKPMHVHVLEVLHDWSYQLNVFDKLPELSGCVGLLALDLLNEKKNTYGEKEDLVKIIEILFKVSSKIEKQFLELLESDVFIDNDDEKRLPYVDTFCRLAFERVGTVFLSRWLPDIVIRLAMHEWIIQADDEDPWSYRHDDLTASYGLHDYRHEFFPASGAKGPFPHLLKWHPRKGLDFLINLCNVTAKKHAFSRLAKEDDSQLAQVDDNDSADESLVRAATDEIIASFNGEIQIKEISLKLNDKKIKQYASRHLWKGYRGLSTLPYLLQSALMAFENWLIEYVQFGVDDGDMEWLVDYILRNSNSVLMTSVLTSVGVGYPKEFGRFLTAILRVPEFYSLDLERSVQEMGRNEPNWFFSSMNRDPFASHYVEERRAAALRSWRKEHLEHLLIRLQLDQENHSQACEALDRLIALAKNSDNDGLRFLVHRADTRHWEPKLDKDNNQIIFESKQELSPELLVKQKETQEQHQYFNDVARLNLWARAIFEKSDEASKYFSNHLEALESAIFLNAQFDKDKADHFWNMLIGAIGRTAAACLRDCACNLDEKQLHWCIRVATEFATRHADAEYLHMSRDVIDANGEAACASILPIIFDFLDNKEDIDNLKYLIAKSITHINENVQSHACEGIRDYLWSRNHDLANQYFLGSIFYAQFMNENIPLMRMRNHPEEHKAKNATEKWLKLKEEFRISIFDGSIAVDFENINRASFSPWHVHLPFLMIPFGSKTIEHSIYIKTIMKWMFDDEYDNNIATEKEKINHDLKQKIDKCFCEHLFVGDSNGYKDYVDLLEDGCFRGPSVLYMAILNFSVKAEGLGCYEKVWNLKRILSPMVQKLAIEAINKKPRGHREERRTLVRGFLFADTPWQKKDYEECEISNGKELIIDFVDKAGRNNDVFYAFCSLMYHFPKVFTGDNILMLARIYKDSKSDALLSSEGTRFCLEMAIQYYLQVQETSRIPRNIFDACILFLNAIVEKSSARAYYLREHLMRTRRIV